MSNCQTCPLVQAINQIRGGGFYNDGAEESDGTIVKIGGGDTEYVCDDTSYYINVRFIELARFELSKPNVEQCKAKFNKLFGWMSENATRRDVCRRMIDASSMKALVYNQFIKLIDILGKLNDFIVAAVVDAGRQGRRVNVSIPDILFPPDVDVYIIYNTKLLTHTMNLVLSYMSKLNINDLLDAPITEKFDVIPDFKPSVDLNFGEKIPAASALQTPEQYMARMKALLQFEADTAKYVQEVEKYNCGVVNQVNRVFSVVEKIIRHVK